MNVWISLCTAFLSLPIGIVAGLWNGKLCNLLPWKPLSFGFHSIGAVPVIGSGFEMLAMIFVPLVIHDSWFYWSRRIEHKNGPMGSQDSHTELMNTATRAC